MVEGEKGSRQANGSSEAVPRQRRSVPADAEEGGTMPSGDLARLLAAVGVLLGAHAPGDLVVLPREELERREFAAYGQGWRDATAQYDELAEWAGSPRDAADGEDRTPGQAAVIPFRPRGAFRARGAARRDADAVGGAPEPADGTLPTPTDHAVAVPDEADSVRVNTEPADPDPVGPAPHASAPNASGRTGPAPDAPSTSSSVYAAPAPEAAPDAPRSAPAADRPAPVADGPGPAAPEAESSPPPVFAPKNRRSKVPTIPRLIRAPKTPKKGRPEGG